LGFDRRPLLEAVSLITETGERIALVGPNGCGKTTLLHAILAARGNDPADTDEKTIWIGPSMKLGWCSQHGEALDPEKTILESCIAAGSLNADAAWKSLSRLLFSRDALEQKTADLSGGERVRLQLALAEISGANFLILDEPTNHLDIVSCEAIEDALAEFAGTILLVSHDRLLLDRVATRIIEITDRHFAEYDGNFSEFWFTRYGDSVRKLSGSSADLRDLRKSGNPVTPPESSVSIESRIITLETERTALEARVEQYRLTGDLTRARDLGTKLAALSARIEKLYADWK
jgi:ATP-binding cassette subfamily F protein 3